MSGYFSFDKLITRTLVKVIYFIGFLILSAGGITLIVWAGMRLHDANIGRQMGWRYVAMGAAALVVGNLAWRVICEFWIVLFNINDQLSLGAYPALNPIRNVQGPQFVERRVVTRENRTAPKDKDIPRREATVPEQESFSAHRPASSVLGLS